MATKVTKAVSVRMYQGNEPADGKLMGTDGQWCLFERETGDTAWRNFKLISLAPRPAKANFHFAYSVKEKRFARGHEILLLRDHEPAVYAWLLEALAACGADVA